MEDKEINPIEERAARLKRLFSLKESGIDPYPSGSETTHTVRSVREGFDRLAESGEAVAVAGRLRAVRGHGGACFADLEDDGVRIQLHLKADVLGASAYETFTDRTDVGDFLQVSGACFLTRRGEPSILVSGVRMLAKSLRPLPSKWHGLADVEVRYRKRYLDLLANPEARAVFVKRSLVIRAIRDFFHAEGYMEVETPILQPQAGGANAEPFVTHHNALGLEMYLRIAPELYLKRLLVGGYSRVFEVSRCFRNEGIDHLHNPEFTQVEFYQAYADYRDFLSLTERLIPELVRAATGGRLTVPHGEGLIDFTPPYPRISFRDAMIRYGGLDIEGYGDRPSLAKAAQEAGVAVESGDGRGKILDKMYKRLVRPKIVSPTFVLDYPVEMLTLAKRRADDPRYSESFQLLAAEGNELLKAFSELNDPIDQRQRFEEQERLRAAGDAEADRVDEDFLEALETGMPPAAGCGIGIDRLMALLTGSRSLKEVMLFPTMRPEDPKQQ